MIQLRIMSALAAATFCLASNAEDGSLLWLDMQRMTHTERIKTNDNSAVAKTRSTNLRLTGTEGT